MGQSAARSVRTHQEVRSKSKHPDDSSTEIPKDVYADFLAAGKAARRRGQHKQFKNKDGVSMLRCSESNRDIAGAASHSGSQQ